MSTLYNVLFCLCLAACAGRCQPADAVNDVVHGATCAVDHNYALCLQGSTLIACTITGVAFHEARCRVVGDVTFRGPALPAPLSEAP